MTLNEKFFNETLEDIRYQYENKIAEYPLFMVELLPEGNPVWDKATNYCKLYARYKKELDKLGIKSGILVQSSLGHDRPLSNPAPFTRYVGARSGKEHFVYCPTDENFLNYLLDAFEKMALEHPNFIMLDDDFRLVTRPNGWGCCCPNHLKEFNKKTGLNLTADNFYQNVRGNATLEKTFFEIQRDTLAYTAKKLREVIDKIDPSIIGMNCTCNDYCESAIEINDAFAGKGNPKIVRMANGTYAPQSSHLFSAYAMRAPAIRVQKLKNHGIDIVLAETDTCPHNRYSKSARYLHSHFVSSILLGAKGAKHWLTRTSIYEPNSGKEYRKILAQHNALYNKLEKNSDQLTWIGCGITYQEQDLPMFSRRLGNEWTNLVLERLGIPFYFTDKNRGVAFMEYDVVKDLSDEQIEDFFEEGSVVVDSEAATDLCKRGFKDKLGVEILNWEDGEDKPSLEWIDEKQGYLQAQINAKKLTVINDQVEIITYNAIKKGTDIKKLAPALTCLDRNGKLAITFSGTPNAPHPRQEFSFLNETRKEQFISLLKRANVLPVYYEGDNEICLTAGYLDNGSLFVSAICLGFDPSDNLTLYLEKSPKGIQKFLPDGSLAPVEFKCLNDRVYSIDIKVEPMYPLLLVIDY